MPSCSFKCHTVFTGSSGRDSPQYKLLPPMWVCTTQQITVFLLLKGELLNKQWTWSKNLAQYKACAFFFFFFSDILNSTGSIVTKTKYIYWRHLKVRKAKSHLSLFDVYLWWCDMSAHRWSYWPNLMWRSYRVLVLEILRFISVLWTKLASLTCAKENLKDYKGILKTKTTFLCFCTLTCLCTSSFYIQDLLLTMVPAPR